MKKTYYQKNIKNIKEYYQANKEKLQKKRREYYKANKEKIKKYCQDNQEKTKKYNKHYYETVTKIKRIKKRKNK